MSKLELKVSDIPFNSPTTLKRCIKLALKEQSQNYLTKGEIERLRKYINTYNLENIDKGNY